MAIPMTLTVSITDRGALGGGSGEQSMQGPAKDALEGRTQAFIRAVTKAQRDAAATATRISRTQVTKTRRPGPLNNGKRFHGLRDAIVWQPTKTGGVQVALSQLDAKFPIWEVHELGTGQKGIRRVADTPNPRGRPKAGARYVRSIKSQVGRRLPNNLVFATGGKYSPPTSSRNDQQLYLRKQISDAPVRFDPETRRAAPGIRIGREIPGMHFIQRGGQAGFREFENNVLAAARSQLRKRRT